jgi:hypothetical protein
MRTEPKIARGRLPNSLSAIPRDWTLFWVRSTRYQPLWERLGSLSVMLTGDRANVLALQSLECPGASALPILYLRSRYGANHAPLR